MEHLTMHTPNLVDENIQKIGGLFPNCLTETKDENGKVVPAIDFDLLRQELSHEIVEGYEERYRFEWPDKRNAILNANSPTTATLRPCRSESVDFDRTRNLYIEGDNLEVLKLLRETYLGKVKMIYIDPPYNTGNDFVYEDDFAQSTDDYMAGSGQFDEEQNRMVANTESNGRFHTDWLNMIYPRLKVAKDLISEDGAIFISIGEEEVHNLKKICDEIYGADNFRNSFITRRYDKNLNRQFMENGLRSFNIGFEYILCYSKSEFLFTPVFRKSSDERQSSGYWKGFWNDADRPTMRYEILGYTPTSGQWKWKQESANEAIKNYQEYENNFSSKMSLEDYWKSTGKIKKFIRRNPNGKGKNAGVENWIEPSDEILRTTNWLDILASKKDNTTQGLFDYPKNVEVIKLIMQTDDKRDSIILDFFSGSATTAHAVMQLNADDGGKRRFIMVQLPELTDEKSEAYEAGYLNICEIGKERIRRAGKKIKEDNKDKPGIDRLDTGFRVLKLDSSNMEDVFYTPDKFDASKLFIDNVKPNRTPEDLLFQVMLMLGIELSASIVERTIGGKKVFSVMNDYLIACFDSNIDESVITEIAKLKPMHFVMRDNSMASDNVADNFEQIFRTYSDSTKRFIL